MKPYPKHLGQIPSSPSELPKEIIPAWLHPESRAYLEKRDVSQWESEFYSLGFCDGGQWNRRIIIPIYKEYPFGDTVTPKLVSFQGRHIDNEEPRYKTEGPRPIYGPFYRRPTETRPAEWTHDSSTLCIVEGPFDLYRTNLYIPTVATLGNLPSQMQIEEILDVIYIMEVRKVCIWYDNLAILEAAALQIKLQPHLTTVIVLNLNRKDPGETPHDEIQLLLENAEK